MTYFISIFDYLHLLVMHGSAVPVTDDIYTPEECESHAVQVMAVRNVELNVPGGGSCQIKEVYLHFMYSGNRKAPERFIVDEFSFDGGNSWPENGCYMHEYEYEYDYCGQFVEVYPFTQPKKMNKYRDKSDFEINKAVAEKPGKPTDKARLLYYIFNW